VNCRNCRTGLLNVVLDLGRAPPSNAYLSAESLSRPEPSYPLRLLHCGICGLVQTEDFHRSEDLFVPDYAYLSSTSSSWLQHARSYADAMCTRLALGPGDLVVELAANDGYLLQYFMPHGVPCLGVEPTAAAAALAEGKGLRILREFFGVALSRRIVAEHGRARLVVANNVLAHVPDVHDFVGGIAQLLQPDGVCTVEFHHLQSLVAGGQFDTVYHEHYSYFSLEAAISLFAANGLQVVEVEQLPTHGGSLRVYAKHKSASSPVDPSVKRVVDDECAAGLRDGARVAVLQAAAERARDGLREFLSNAKRQGALVAAYGAAAKGNTLLNFAGTTAADVAFVCDAAQTKQGRYLPGSHIPILSPKALVERKPEYVLLLPWNLRRELEGELAFVRGWGGRFVTAVPSIAIN